MFRLRAGFGVPSQMAKGRLQLWPQAAVAIAALAMTWPALYNGFPLLYPDSMTYILDGRLVARALFLHHYSTYYGMRSFIYSLALLPLDWNLNPWPIVFAQAILAASTLWLLIRSLRARHATIFFLLLAGLLSLLTTLSWYVSIVMPDILGPLMYLGIYLLVFAPTSLSRGERWFLRFVVWLAAASHITHLMLASGLCLLLALLISLRRPSRPLRLRLLAGVAAVLLLSAGATMALHGFLYDKPSLNGDRPPYLMARIIADGPGRMYLEKNCPQLKWTICGSVGRLPGNADDFLWEPGGVWDGASESQQKQILREEMPLVLATLRTYPREQLAKSWNNFISQLRAYGIEDFDPSSWVLDQFPSTLPGQRSAYIESRQQRDALPLEFITSLQDWVVLVSLILIAASIALLWRRRPSRLVWLGVVIVSIIVANAFLSGTLSMVDDRYQARVIWLLPLLAGLLWMEAWESIRQFWPARLKRQTGRSHPK